MAITFRKWLDGKVPENDYDLAVLSDQLWKLGSLEKIRQAVDTDVFNVFVAMNIIGNWEGDGWGCLIGDQPILVPHVTPALEFFGFTEIDAAFRNVVQLFPAFTVFQHDRDYCDVINFLQSPRFKIKNKSLRQYTAAERAQMSRQFNEAIDELEQVTEGAWLGGQGWTVIIQFLREVD